MRSNHKFFGQLLRNVALGKLKGGFRFSSASSSTVETNSPTPFSGLKPIEAEHSTKVPSGASFEKMLSNLDLPYSFTGNLIEAKEYTGYMGERVFAQHKIPKNMIIDHVYKIYQGTLYSIANLDEEFLEEYLEADFAKRLIDSLKKMKNSGYEIKVIEDQQGRRGEPVPLQRRIIDMTMVKGLNAIRKENKKETEYHKYVDIDDMGLVVYTPVEVTDPRNFSNPEKNKTIYDGTRQVVFRMLIEIQSPLRLHLTTPEGKEVYLHNQEYTWKHVALFETQMKEPPKFTSFSKLETFMEWLGKYKFGVWKIADIDNYMKGNPLIKDSVTREGFKDEVFKGSKYDTDATINIKNI